MKSFQFYKQHNSMDCGVTCLRMIAKHFGKSYNITSLKNKAGFNKEGVTMLGICEAAEEIGMRGTGYQLRLDQLKQLSLPCIVHWDTQHFVVLISIKGKKSKEIYTIADPAQGIIQLDSDSFSGSWTSNVTFDNHRLGNVLVLDPTEQFFEGQEDVSKRLSWKTVTHYFRNHRWRISQILIAFLITSLIQLIFPFLTQSIVDVGITSQDLQYVTLVLIAQLMLVFSKSIVEFIRVKLLLKVSVIVNLSILSDFWIKITKLPLNYFESHQTGDVLQRINDNKTIQSFFTTSTIAVLFSTLNFFIYSIILLIYNWQLFVFFGVGSILYFMWIKAFLGIRRRLNYATFGLYSKENSASLQMIQGMAELRLNNAEKMKRWKWEGIQAQIFKINNSSFNYSQIQNSGALLINQGKDVFITFFVARLVIEGQLTLGAMLAVQYILGQLTSPVEQFVGFIQNSQDAKIAMERLNEIHDLKDESPSHESFVSELLAEKNIKIKDLSFKYPGSTNSEVLNKISFEICENRITAIVGLSGSGKTTLLKLLMMYYQDYDGEIYVGQTKLKNIHAPYWRSQCGVVMQDGYIFNDTIANNIALGQWAPDIHHLIKCCKIANILDFVESLSNGFNTRLGTEGVGISQGQRQRILIARAIYKNPDYIFFDEATNSLDANNEKEIVQNLREVFLGKTVVIIAHRLSTVRNADNIIVLDRGCIVEQGNHSDLTNLKGKYYELVQNQLM